MSLDAVPSSTSKLPESRSNSISNPRLLETTASARIKLEATQIAATCGTSNMPGTQPFTKAKVDLINPVDSFSSVGGSARKGRSNDPPVVSLLGQGTSGLQTMQNPQKLCEFKMGSLVSSGGKAGNGVHSGGSYSKELNMGLASCSHTANCNSMNKKMFSQMGSNIIQGETSSVGGNSAIRAKPTSQSGMGNIHMTTQSFMVPVMIKKQNNFMVGSGTQLSVQNAVSQADKTQSHLYNSDSKKLTLLP